MKKFNYFIVILIISYLIISTASLITYIPYPSICMAAEKVTPYEPGVKYTRPISKEPEEAPEIKPPNKKKKWLWIVGGIVIAGAAAALAGGGSGSSGGGNGDDGTPPPGEDAEVDITW